MILFEPFFDLYVNQVKLAGGTPVFVPLTFKAYNEDDDDIVTGGEWVLEPDMLKKYVSPKTKAIVLNSPHNPTGKIWSESDYENLELILEKHPNVILLSDEVYEYISFKHAHISVNSRPKLKERAVVASSFGKCSFWVPQALLSIRFLPLVVRNAPLKTRITPVISCAMTFPP